MPQVACPEGEFRRVQQALAFWTIFFYRQTVTSACSAEPTTVLFIFGVTFFFTVSDIKVERFVKVNKENPWLIVVFIPLKKLSLTCIIYGNVTKCQWRVSDLIPLDQYGMCIINLSPKLFNLSEYRNTPDFIKGT